ncbi:MAG: TolC family protein, partial [Magnetococcales bacterium]|nr:TolC family protein [Magnetococcales bacterium]
DGEKTGHTTTNPDFHLAPFERNLTLNQTLWDFGKTATETNRAEVASQLSAITVEITRQTLLYEGAAAWGNLCRAVGTVEFARRSVENIRQQTGIEESRVELGSGLPTDVLQAKSQLAGAEARLVRAEGSLNLAMNRYLALFGELPPPPEKLHRVEIKKALVPDSLDTLLQEGMNQNLDIHSANKSVELSRLRVDQNRTNILAPRVSAILEYRNNRETDVTNLKQEEMLAKVEASFSLNTGLSGVHALDEAREGLEASRNRLGDTRRTTEEQLRNAWDNLQTALRNKALLADQAAISDAFLQLAKEERLLGRRSLIDVLSGETSLINAQADVLSAQVDVDIATFSQLRTMGQLSFDSFQELAEPCLMEKKSKKESKKKNNLK